MTTDDRIFDMIRAAQSMGENAKAQITTHEAVCAERWMACRDSLSQLQASLKRLFGYLVAGGGALIAGMATLIVIFVFKGKF